ncbi:Bax protein [Gammaproteobacteria bacterium]
MRATFESKSLRVLALFLALYSLDSTAASKRSESKDSQAIEETSEEVGESKHQSFVDTLLPLLRMENDAIEGKRKKMLRHFSSLARGESLGAAEREWLRDLAEDYRVDRDPLNDSQARREMIRRVDVIPVDLALAQAATETGWGTSHAARKDRDLFGMTGMRTPKARTASGRVVRAPKFASLRDSVRTYIHNLNVHGAYQPLRTIRTQLRAENKPIQGGAVADGLVRYSTRGTSYVRQIRAVIRQNRFNQYTSSHRIATIDGDSNNAN